MSYISRNQLIENGDEIKQKLVRANALNKIRNLVAHNPTILRKFDNTDFEDVIADLRGKHSPINIAQLHEYSDEVMSIASELFILASQSTGRCITEFIMLREP